MTRKLPPDSLKYAFVYPALIFLIALNIFPLLYNLYLSFRNAQLSGGAVSFVGGDNYTKIFSALKYVAAIRTTTIFVVTAVSIELLLGFVVALSLQSNFRAKPEVLTLLLVPMMLSPAVMGLYWNLILNGNYGILNQALGVLGVSQPQWLTNPDLKLLSILLIALAGLNTIPAQLYEAAEIARASRWTVFRRITLPLCAPLLFHLDFPLHRHPYGIGGLSSLIVPKSAADEAGSNAGGHGIPPRRRCGGDRHDLGIVWR